MGDAEEVRKAEIAFAPLNAPHVCAVESAEMGRVLLREALLMAYGANRSPECAVSCRLGWRHSVDARDLTTKRPRTMSIIETLLRPVL